jgi:hypothetical protein
MGILKFLSVFAVHLVRAKPGWIADLNLIQVYQEIPLNSPQILIKSLSISTLNSIKFHQLPKIQIFEPHALNFTFPTPPLSF